LLGYVDRLEMGVVCDEGNVKVLWEEASMVFEGEIPRYPQSANLGTNDTIKRFSKYLAAEGERKK